MAQPTMTGLDPDLARFLRLRAASLVDLTVTQIQAGVLAYAGAGHRRSGRLVESAVSGAVTYVADAIEGRTAGRAEVDVLFRRLGRAEALDGNSLEVIREAHEIVTRAVWHTVHTIAVSIGLSGAARGQLGDAFLAFMGQLGEQLALGFHAACAELGGASQEARANLVENLLAPAPGGDLQLLAALARWPLARALVLAVGESIRGGPADAVLLDADLLVHVDRGRTVVVIPERGPHDAHAHRTDGSAFPHPDLIEELRAVLALDLVVVSWPVPTDEAPDAFRWCRRALHLARHGVIEPTPVISCADHITTLWLHSEPLLRRQISRDVLAPLLHETPRSREVLARTLLAWLSSHDSAPALAKRLGVHPQTVRYRLRRLQALFGGSLADPHVVLAMKLALEASVPLWAAGHLFTDVEDLSE